MYGYTSRVSTIFSTKGNNFCDFLFNLLDKVVLVKWVLFLKEKQEEFAPRGATSFL